MKKVISLLIAVALICTLATVAFADDSYTITITAQTSEHEYEAYQVFTGDLTGDVLSNVVWGSGIDAASLLAELNTLDAYAACTSAAEVAEVLKAFGDKSAELDAFAAIVAKHLSTTFAASTGEGNTYTIAVAEPGYYFLKDKDGSLAGEWDAYTKFILEVVKDVEVNAKMSLPTLDKWVWNDDAEQWDDYSDYNISDIVPFKLYGTLPEDLNTYSKYSYTFHDTLCAGLDFVEGSVKVMLDTETGTDITTYFTVTESEGTLTIHAEDLLAIDGITGNNDIVVLYDAILDTDAVIGNPGNPNEVYLEYSNNPNWVGEGEADETPTGETTKVEVLVFTFETDVKKIDATTKEALAGAEFVLYTEDNKFVVLDAESKVASWTENEEEATVLTSDENGLFKVIGIEPGTYFLKETNAPEGYNKLAEPVKLVVAATYEENSVGLEQVLTLTLSVNGGAAQEGTTGIVTVEVENKAGTVLPSTGGIGTTIFYVLGGLLLVGTAVLLITKKRLGEE